MAARAERGRRVDFQNAAALRVVHGFPRGLDHERMADRERLEILLPAPFPVLLTGERGFGDEPSPCVLLVACLEVFERSAQRGVLLRARLIVRKVNLQTSLLRTLFAHKLLVNIIPVDLGVLEELLEIGRVLQNVALDAVILQNRLDRADARGGGVDGDLSPVHPYLAPPFIYAV